MLLADFGLAKQVPKGQGQPGFLVGACGTKVREEGARRCLFSMHLCDL